MMLSSSVILETSVFLKEMLKQMLFQGKSESFFSRMTGPAHRKTSHCIYYSGCGWSEDWQLSREAAHHWESEPVANTNTHENTCQHIAMFEPLSLSPTCRPSSLTSLDDYSIFLHRQSPPHLKILCEWAGGIYFYWATKMHKDYTLNDLLRRSSLV